MVNLLRKNLSALKWKICLAIGIALGFRAILLLLTAGFILKSLDPNEPGGESYTWAAIIIGILAGMLQASIELPKMCFKVPREPVRKQLLFSALDSWFSLLFLGLFSQVSRSSFEIVVNPIHKWSLAEVLAFARIFLAALVMIFFGALFNSSIRALRNSEELAEKSQKNY